MAKIFKEIDPQQIKGNPFKLIGKDWMLITAGTPESFNTMTANWGGLGFLWNKNVCFCVVRPTRHTYNFIDKSGYFTLSFFEEKYREILNFCGSTSGKNVNKVAETGLTPVTGKDAIYFEEARLVLECRKIYFHDINPKHFLYPEIDGFYPKKDYHRMYIGEIIRCLVKD
ncbi:MAG: flavin reductase family protein [Nitrospinae bacterium]|nr:flavin reductase family protein [Nitrospinota bacterium]MBI3813603.1 flavin reductase family protein [Nitrospinota bacterium]